MKTARQKHPQAAFSTEYLMALQATHEDETAAPEPRP